MGTKGSLNFDDDNLVSEELMQHDSNNAEQEGTGERATAPRLPAIPEGDEEDAMFQEFSE